MTTDAAKSAIPKIVVAGHICLDIIPSFPATEAGAAIEPGLLYIVGPAVRATGGAVSNTGLALHHLGVPTSLIGKVGADLFGGETLQILHAIDPLLAEGMIVAPAEDSSYTVVINPPGVDRSFLHCTGANDTFLANDIDYDSLAGSKLIHFGYPTLMQRIYEDSGQQMSQLFEQSRARGLLTSLDMAMPDANSPAGRVDWRVWLEHVLPAVDVYLPSIDETLFMLRRPQFNQLSQAAGGGDLGRLVDANLLRELAEELLSMGAGTVVLKLGDQGLYLRSGKTNRLASGWQDRELLTPCFQVKVVGTTGAGDCTIAGFLAALVEGTSPEEALVDAVAVGACSVEVADATSGISPLPDVRNRIAAGWQRHTPALDLPGWTWNEAAGVWSGPSDSKM
ncbi:MAG: hypothetical protein KDA57_16500 [Planctomycetales bacterium]|nr:hypothetical protein [Planctomycetales bacterium]